ncbi:MULTISPECIES: rRNA maturation RNase YbeY [Chryseobacterium]|uniref:Endoribonuclease YbeY n=1 Tax=Chryseobacterium geocarposphaerae TaxID=1416776 RepID=A0ABU1LE77_9FLAO|nr:MULTISPECIES: rRNA maturation RNase YbeY [Chryseobacterium]ALR32118.1 rRNA maturation factor [Chryseobacterium sp. IHB B 17019]MDR6405027.1 rRNA maturation RNase YbeY [Chryseobacterium geocarposphaerae]MDR6697810.1 rRNA maturation RNase YbeY [Chryseobacterium ginsenosidimutans]
MIQFFYENLPESVHADYKKWLEDIILSEGKKLGEINYIFCDDEYLLKVNQDYLQHDYYTDIITFDYVKGKTISGEIFVSLQRISDNASTLSREYEEELRRVLAHGILHLCGYKDKTEEEEQLMRSKEDHYLAKYNN